MLWVLKRTISIRRFFWAPKTYVQTDGLVYIQGRRRLLESGTAIEHRWCSLSADGTSGGEDEGA